MCDIIGKRFCVHMVGCVGSVSFENLGRRGLYLSL